MTLFFKPGNACSHFLAETVTEPALLAGCSNNNDCPDHAACENRQCINPCAIRDPCAASANCKVFNHQPICTCPDGYVGTPNVDCRLRKYYRDIVFVVKLDKDKYQAVYTYYYYIKSV
jgi:hypothetical protein